MKKRDYNTYDFSKFLSLDEKSPTGLSWNAPRLYAGKLNYSRVGQPAGHVRIFNDRQSYYVVTVFNQTFFVHRIIYILKHGSVGLDKDVDHIDGNSLNNSTDNLIEKTAAENARNRRKKSNKELSTGIYIESSISKSGEVLRRVRAHYSYGDKVYGRSWAIGRWGEENALNLAMEWRIAQIERLNEENFGYTERHGK
jgi:hypothetical protein